MNPSSNPFQSGIGSMWPWFGLWSEVGYCCFRD